MATRRPSANPKKTPARATTRGAQEAGSAAPPRRGKGRRGGDDEGGEVPPTPAALHELTQARYLNYALSVITSRALPDVRDGLKPVQRRILFTMWQQRLTAEAKHRKCAKVVGDVMGNYHPHGDGAIYDALVRIAQPFSLRVPLVDGSGNFGSLDGDPAAAMRYTECRLAPPAGELLGELSQDTVHFRPNYDGSKTEPVVLPSKLPNLLINGATGIAVGMATNIPPHNPEEICAAAIRLLDALMQGKELSNRELCRTVKGPDFPTGGQIVSTPEELKQIYETGQGAVKLRGTWRHAEPTRGSRSTKTLIIDSIPFAVNKSTLVERLAEVVTSRKMPLLLDVRDISGEDVAIELELKADADEAKVLAYLYKNTPLQTNFNVNLTCLVPTENPEVGRPERLDLQSMLWHFLQFRLEVVTRRLQHELGQLERRIHILDGFAKVFDALTEIINLIRKSDGKADAAAKIMQRFKLDAEQTDAILELKLYRLARLEILVIQDELKQKKKRVSEIKKLLSGPAGRWAVVKDELSDVQRSLGAASRRRTLIEAVEAEPEFSAEDLIVAEDAQVLLTTDGWVKRQRDVKDVSKVRLREGDSILAWLAGSTRATAVFFSSFGTAYTCRIIDIPATTGYGEPIQKLFKLKDGESIVAAQSLDSRLTGDLLGSESHYPSTFALAATTDGYGLCFSLAPFAEPSTRAGRRFARPAKGHRVLDVVSVHGDETLIAASRDRRALLCAVSEVSYLSGPGKGVQLIKLGKGDELVGILAAENEGDALTLRTSLGGEQRVSRSRFELTGRGGKGREVMKRGTLVAAVRGPAAPPPELSES
ncbi:MAG: DNA topoisomerase IV subunit A [Polyangiaceae bacterium]|nr:DNA topoisomerase IV subunit A [Polyangiaceae bacterium]MCW5790930.1 DNA topoisomerase IV subunit A [Polyangiaceae bacterium]